MHHAKVYVMHFVVLEHPCKDAICELDPVSAISSAESRTNMALNRLFILPGP